MRTLLAIAALATTAALCLPAHAGAYSPGQEVGKPTFGDVAFPYIAMSDAGRYRAGSFIEIDLQNGQTVPGASISAGYKSTIEWTWVANPQDPNGDPAPPWSVTAVTVYQGQSDVRLDGPGAYGAVNGFLSAQLTANGVNSPLSSVNYPRNVNDTYTGGFTLGVATQPANAHVTTVIVLHSLSTINGAGAGHQGITHVGAGTNQVSITSCAVQ